MYPFTWTLSSLKFPPLKFTRTLSKLTHSLFSRLCVQNCFCFFWGFFWAIVKLLHLKYRIYLKIKNKKLLWGRGGKWVEEKNRCKMYHILTYIQTTPRGEKANCSKKKKIFCLTYLSGTILVDGGDIFFWFPESKMQIEALRRKVGGRHDTTLTIYYFSAGQYLLISVYLLDGTGSLINYLQK